MTRDDRLRSTEIYLTNLDDHLLARGVDPRVRLDYVEQVADTVMTTGSDPEEEFGSAEDYATALSESLGAARRRPWTRVVAAGLGFLLLEQGLSGLGTYRRRSQWGLLDRPEELLLPMSVVPLVLVLLSAWIMLSPAGVRLVSVRLNRLPGRGQVAVAAALLVPLVAVIAIGPYAIELPSTRAMLPAFVVAAIAGPAFLWWSGLPQLFWSVMRTGARRDSSMSYNPFGAPKVKLNTRNQSQTRTQPSPTRQP